MENRLSDKKEAPRVLVVDDDPLVLRLITRVLVHAGFAIQTLSNGLGVLSALQQGGIDLIIIDLVMPDQEGIETIRQIREKRISVPIVATSGFDGEFLKAALLLGANESLQKPFSVWDLLQAVERAIANRRSI